MRVMFAYAVSTLAAVATLTARSKMSRGEVDPDAKGAIAGHPAPLMGKIAGRGKHNENGAQLAAGHITTDGRANSGQRSEASGIRAILTSINSVQPDVSQSGGMSTTGGRPAQRAAGFGIRAKILGGDGVYTDKVGELAAFAMRNPVWSKAAIELSASHPGVGFDQQAEDHSHTPVQIDAPFAQEVMCVFVEAMKRANSIDAPKVLTAVSSTGYGVIGGIAIDYEGDLKEGAITLYDFRDSEAAVLDAVEM